MSKAWYDYEPWQVSGLDYQQREALEKRFGAIENKIIGLQIEIVRTHNEIKKLGGEQTMKIFTEKAFENRLARERERMERDRYIMERLDKTTTDLNELTWRVNALEADAKRDKTPVCEEVLKCEGR